MIIEYTIDSILIIIRKYEKNTPLKRKRTSDRG